LGSLITPYYFLFHGGTVYGKIVRKAPNLYENKVPDAPHILFEALKAQKQRLEAVREKLGDYVVPEALP